MYKEKELATWCNVLRRLKQIKVMYLKYIDTYDKGNSITIRKEIKEKGIRIVLLENGYCLSRKM
jgi:hypothetical protein